MDLLRSRTVMAPVSEVRVISEPVLFESLFPEGETVMGAVAVLTLTVTPSGTEIS
jgi:hypothetical protein